MRHRRLIPAVSASFVVLVALVVGPATAGGGHSAGTARAVPKSNKGILFASDGVREDMVNHYARQGAMRTFRALIRDGAQGQNGLLQAFPPNTGVGWYTLATGTWPSEHGSTNNTFHRTGDQFSNRTAFSTNAIL